VDQYHSLLVVIKQEYKQFNLILFYQHDYKPSLHRYRLYIRATLLRRATTSKMVSVDGKMERSFVVKVLRSSMSHCHLHAFFVPEGRNAI
jgi:hypothetical protein